VQALEPDAYVDIGHGSSSSFHAGVIFFSLRGSKYTILMNSVHRSDSGTHR
jgi:hypothetical protein